MGDRGSGDRHMDLMYWTRYIELLEIKRGFSEACTRVSELSSTTCVTAIVF